MRKGNGQCSLHTASRSCQNRGFCVGNRGQNLMANEPTQARLAMQAASLPGCRGPHGCGNGMPSGFARRRGSCSKNCSRQTEQ
jgi:hypothetical protein